MSLRLWRLMKAGAVQAPMGPLAPAQNPEGRFHHSGQRALYASLSAQGAQLAMTRYGECRDRVLIQLELRDPALVDARDPGALPPGAAVADVTSRWDRALAEGRFPATWRLSDALRARGVQGMIYPSRQASRLAHVVLFDWNRPGTQNLTLC